MSISRPTLVIASVGVSPTPISVSIVAPIEPLTRENGGDLQNGDRWFDPTRSIESIWIDYAWRQVSSVNLNN